MKTRLRKIISVVLCVLMASSVMAPAVSAQNDLDVQAAAETQDIPIVAVPGTGNTTIYNAEGKKIIPDDVELTDVLKDENVTKPVLQALAVSAATNNWNIYADAMYDAIAPIYAEQVLDKNGEASDGSHPGWSWSKSSLRKKTSNFGMYDYVYRYDERLSPMVIADDLKAYIDAVLAVTGKSKVALIGRCYGSCIVSAYLSKYADENKIDNTVMYVPMVKGNEAVEAVFTGKLFIDPDNVDIFAGDYLSKNDIFGDSNINEMVIALVTMLNYIKALGFASDVVNEILVKVRDRLIPRLLRDIFGRDMSNWSMVGEDVYEEAKEFVYAGYEEEYSELIKKLDDYNYNAKAPLYNILDGLIDKGMKISVYAKYGTATYPLYEGADCQSDNSNSVYRMSFGATTSPINDVLSDEYIANAVNAGTAKYISADKKIDASTCKYPDSTWFIKNVSHTDLPACIDEIILFNIRSTKQRTVWDNEKYPQFTNYNKQENKLEIITGSDESDKKFDRNPLVALMRFLTAFFRFITSKLIGDKK